MNPPTPISAPASKTFIVGPPRAGTTLVRDLLALHPEISAHGEDFHSFHHDLTRFKHRAEGEDHFRLTTGDASDAIRQQYHQAISEKCQAPHFVLKISTLSIQVDYVRALFPDAKFIQIVRDGRDVACSMEDLRRAIQSERGKERLLGPAPDPLSLWCANQGWDKYLCAALAWSYHATRSYLDLRFCGDENWLRIRYEDFIKNPKQTLEQLQAFIGVPADDALMEKAERAVTVVPNPREPIGFSTCDASGPRVKRYLRNLKPEHRLLMAPFLEAPMLHMGYQPDPWPERDPFYDAAAALGVDPDALKDCAYRESQWYTEQYEVFSARHGMGEASLSVLSKPLLVDGAFIGSSASVVDGGLADPISWVQKQERRHTFPDPQSAWVRAAPFLNGQTTFEELQEAFGLPSNAPAILYELRNQGFVGWR